MTLLTIFILYFKILEINFNILQVGGIDIVFGIANNVFKWQKELS